MKNVILKRQITDFNVICLFLWYNGNNCKGGERDEVAD